MIHQKPVLSFNDSLSKKVVVAKEWPISFWTFLWTCQEFCQFNRDFPVHVHQCQPVETHSSHRWTKMCFKSLQTTVGSLALYCSDWKCKECERSSHCSASGFPRGCMEGKAVGLFFLSISTSDTNNVTQLQLQLLLLANHFPQKLASPLVPSGRRPGLGMMAAWPAVSCRLSQAISQCLNLLLNSDRKGSRNEITTLYTEIVLRSFAWVVIS